MPFDRNNLNPVTRFYLSDEHGGQTEEWVELRRPSLKESREFRKKATKRRVEYKGTQRFEVADFNDELWDEMFWDATISNWYILQPDGKEIPCTKEDKLLLVYGSPEFLRFLNDCVLKLNADLTNVQEESEKN